MLVFVPLIMAGLATASVNPDRVTPPPARARWLASGFNQPVSVKSPPNDFNHVFVCEAPGQIRVVDAATGQIAPQPFLDISALVDNVLDIGLLDMAFDPDYATNGFVYVSYIADRDFVWYWELARYRAGPETLTADPTSALVLLSLVHPHYGHTGGWLGFSPVNGYLYTSIGDGAFGFPDPPNWAQTIDDQLQGKMLRIDVRSAGPPDPGLGTGRAAGKLGGPIGANYYIPPTNPFVDLPGDDEIWAYGLRNPWKCSFDRATGDLYIGDVGENTWEEVNMEPASSPGGRNYGWRCMEGNLCTNFGGCSCVQGTLTGPLYAYPRSLGRSVIGGYVYRGSAIPEYQGLYFFGDWGFNRFWTFRPVMGSVQEFTDRTPEMQNPYAPQVSGIAAFGEDAAGELYMASVNTGTLYKIVPRNCPPVIDRQPAGVEGLIGRAMTLSVIGAGTSPMSFQWRKDGVPLINDSRVNGSTSPTLTVIDLTQQDAGSYDVVLVNMCGSATSDQSTVTVACLADFNRTGAVTVEDLFAYLRAWIAQDPKTDVNETGTVTIQDLFDFMSAWFSGCG